MPIPRPPHRRLPSPAALAALGLLLGLLAACAQLPEVPPVDSEGVQPKVTGVRGPLSDSQSRALIGKLAKEPGTKGLLERHAAIEQAVAETPLIAGNRTHLLRDGDQTFAAMFAAMKSARHHINLEYFILEDIEYGGLHLGDLLAERRAAGVAVNIIYDSYGSAGTAKSFIDRLRKMGCAVVEFNPLNPLQAKTGWSPNDRDHRKILVVDGATAIVGGVNLSTTYEDNPPPGKQGGGEPGKEGEKALDDKPPLHWRDTDLEIEGPAVAQLQSLFLEHWAAQLGPGIDTRFFFPTIPPAGSEVLRIVGSTPDRQEPRYYVTLISAIRSAEKSIYLSAAYFVPTHEEVEAMEQAARRGVDVRLLVPDKSDSDFAIDVGQSRYADLMEAGVKIFQTHDLFLHTKTVTIDGVWSVVGSSNFDHRSVLWNDEVDAVVLGTDTADQLARMFEADCAKATRLDPEKWEDRPLDARIKALFARMWQQLL